MDAALAALLKEHAAHLELDSAASRVKCRLSGHTMVARTAIVQQYVGCAPSAWSRGCSRRLTRGAGARSSPRCAVDRKSWSRWSRHAAAACGAPPPRLTRAAAPVWAAHCALQVLQARAQRGGATAGGGWLSLQRLPLLPHHGQAGSRQGGGRGAPQRRQEFQSAVRCDARC